MFPPLRLLLPIALLAGVTIGTAQESPPQRVPVSQLIRLDDLEAESVKTPEYNPKVSGMSVQRDGRRSWLQLRVDFRTAPEWMDEVTFTFHVALQGDPEDMPQGSEAVNMFTGTVTYINIPRGDHRATMYLDPNTFLRYGDVRAVAVVANVGGELAGGLVEPESSAASEWWKKRTANSIPLMPRNETPYAFVEIDRQETVKP